MLGQTRITVANVWPFGEEDSLPVNPKNSQYAGIFCSELSRGFCVKYSSTRSNGKHAPMFSILGELNSTFHMVCLNTHRNPPTAASMSGEKATKYVQYLLWQRDLK